LTVSAWLVSVATLSFVMSATPGPNNVLFAASGARVGYARTLPGIAGMLMGFAMILAACAAGVGEVVARAPRAQLAMTVVASTYMLWLARRLWTADTTNLAQGPNAQGLITWWQMAVLQLANPKTWLASLAFASGYLAANSPGGVTVDLVGVCVFLLVVSISSSAWTIFGAAFRARRSSSLWQQRFNRTLAVVAVLTIATFWI
jgi:threonine/homoserine/homoserine lactone efflux protein